MCYTRFETIETMSVRYSYAFKRNLEIIEISNNMTTIPPFGFVTDIADFDIIKKSVKKCVNEINDLANVECIIEKGYRTDDGYMISVIRVAHLKQQDLEKLHDNEYSLEKYN